MHVLEAWSLHASQDPSCRRLVVGRGLYIKSVQKTVRQAGLSRQAGGSGSRRGPEVKLGRGGWKQSFGILRMMHPPDNAHAYILNPEDHASVNGFRQTEGSRLRAGSEGNQARIGRKQMSDINIRSGNHAHRFTYLANITPTSNCLRTSRCTQPRQPCLEERCQDSQYGRASGQDPKSTWCVSARSKGRVCEADFGTTPVDLHASRGSSHRRQGVGGWYIYSRPGKDQE
jgi:hypothetical protein